MRNAKRDTKDTLTTGNVLPLIALVAMIALSIRYTIATGDSLWLDELHTAWTVGDGLPQVAGRAADGNQNPLFFWLTWIFTQVLGKHELSLRLASILAGTGLVAGAGWLAWRGSKSVLGVLVTCLIAALDWRFVFYGTEARPYALMQLLGLLHAGLFANLVGWLPSSEPNHSKNRLSQSTKWSGLTLLSIALFYCHITSVWLFAAEAIAMILAAKGSGSHSSSEQNGTPSPFFKPLLLSAGAALVGCLPGVLTLTTVFARKSNWSELSSPAGVFADSCEPLLYWVALPLLLFAIGWLGKKFLLAAKPQEQNRFQSHKLSVFVFIWAITPIAGVIAAHYLHVAPLALFRYTVVGTPAMAIFAGLIIGRMPGIVLKIIAIAIIAWSSYGNNEITRQLVDRQTLPVLRHEDWGSLAGVISGTGHKDYQPVLLFANVIEDTDAAANLDPRFQDYLRFPAYNIHDSTGFGRQAFPCSTHNSPRFPERLAQRVLKAGGGWLLIRGSDTTVQSILVEVEQALSENLPADANKKLRIEERNDNGDVVHLFSVDLL